MYHCTPVSGAGITHGCSRDGRNTLCIAVFTQGSSIEQNYLLWPRNRKARTFDQVLPVSFNLSTKLSGDWIISKVPRINGIYFRFSSSL